MIAPLRPPYETSGARIRREQLSRARRLMAAMLLHTGESSSQAPAMNAWQAWLLTLWAIVVSGCYLHAMFGLPP
jgi:hypothetical protein